MWSRHRIGFRSIFAYNLPPIVLNNISIVLGKIPTSSSVPVSNTRKKGPGYYREQRTNINEDKDNWFQSQGTHKEFRGQLQSEAMFAVLLDCFWNTTHSLDITGHHLKTAGILCIGLALREGGKKLQQKPTFNKSANFERCFPGFLSSLKQSWRTTREMSLLQCCIHPPNLPNK